METLLCSQSTDSLLSARETLDLKVFFSKVSNRLYDGPHWRVIDSHVGRFFATIKIPTRDPWIANSAEHWLFQFGKF